MTSWVKKDLPMVDLEYWATIRLLLVHHRKQKKNQSRKKQIMFLQTLKNLKILIKWKNQP